MQQILPVCHLPFFPLAQISVDEMPNPVGIRRRIVGACLGFALMAACRHSPPPTPVVRAPETMPNNAPASVSNGVPASSPAPAITEVAPAKAKTPASPPVVSTPAPPRATGVTPTYTPEEELARFRLPPGYHAELVAAEPFVVDPVAIDFDADGRMYVVEMRGFMPNVKGTGEDRPVGRIVVLEDTDGDGRMDKQTVFLDSLVLPRAIKVLERGVLIAAPPFLWLARDTTGDFRADVREVVSDAYGSAAGNPEHNANGLLWGIDNWIHNANFPGEFHIAPNRKFIFRKTPQEGQWGVSMDDYGRLFRNSNEDPLRADLVPSHYAMRNPNLATMRGVYERLTPNIAVWPAHKTPAVNRGYRAETLRPDSTLAHYTSAGSPTAFVGDRLPEELHHSVFVTESAGNLLGRFIVSERADGSVTAHTAYDHAEFMTGDDERFRPVNVANAPDGTMYVVDMYRGIIEHRAYITGYLEQKIVERGLEGPLGYGRIWRIVHDSSRRGEAPRLSSKAPADLVPLLAHPNGWWRITAQRLLVERGDRSVAPVVRDLLRANRDPRARLHALWTLDGLGEADTISVRAGLTDASPDVRAAAIRIAEPYLARADDPLTADVTRLAGDDAPIVRRQLAASLGELPVTIRDSALAAIVARHGDDPIVADLVVSGVAGRELPFLERILAAKPSAASDTTARALANAIVRSRDAGAVQRLLALAGETSRPRSQRLALLSGLQEQRGGFVVALPVKPASLLAAMSSKDAAVRAAARRAAETVEWPGKATKVEPPRPLTPAERTRFVAGQKQYAVSCAGCHQVGGTGLAGTAKPLIGSPWANAPAPRVIRIVLHGKEGQMLMPPVGSSLSDDQIAAVLTYVRRSWGNAASPIAPSDVKEVRGATAGRNRPWTEAELARVR